MERRAPARADVMPRGDGPRVLQQPHAHHGTQQPQEGTHTTHSAVLVVCSCFSLPLPSQVSVIWSYDVSWVPSDVRWASRWDVYLSMGDIFSDEIHWFAIANSFIIVLFLTGMVAMILVRAL